MPEHVIERNCSGMRAWPISALAPAFILLAVGGVAAGEAARLTLQADVSSGTGKCEITYDHARYSETDIRNSFRVLRQTFAYLIPSLNLCLDSDPRYRDCGSRSLGAPNFLHNAKVNLDEGRRRIHELEKLPLSAAVDPLRRRLLEDMRFDLWKEEHVYQLYSTRKLEALTARFGNLDIEQRCKSAIAGVKNAMATPDLERTVGHDWRSCVNALWRRMAGGDRATAWTKLVISEVCEGENEND